MACAILNTGGAQYTSLASFAFLVTAVLLLILICKASLRQSSIWLTVELVICLILTICYIVATIDIFRLCWYIFNHFQLGPFIGCLIATVCIQIIYYLLTFIIIYLVFVFTILNNSVLLNYSFVLLFSILNNNNFVLFNRKSHT